MGLKKDFRIRGKNDIVLLFRSGRRIESPFFRVFVRQNRGSHARFAFVISRKTARSAVVRNRLRRRARDFVRRNESVRSRSMDVAILFKPDAVSADRREFYNALGHVLSGIQSEA